MDFSKLGGGMPKGGGMPGAGGMPEDDKFKDFEADPLADMGEDPMGGGGLQSALEGAGYQVTPDQLKQIENILGQPGMSGGEDDLLGGEGDLGGGGAGLPGMDMQF